VCGCSGRPPRTWASALGDSFDAQPAQSTICVNRFGIASPKINHEETKNTKKDWKKSLCASFFVDDFYRFSAPSKTAQIK
jgi:hypothetical protein